MRIHNLYKLCSALLIALCSGTIVWGQTQLGADIDGKTSNPVHYLSGSAVSLDDTRVAIGAPGDGYTYGTIGLGYVSIYEWNGTAWQQLGQDLNGENHKDRFGHAVSLDDKRIAIGAINANSTWEGRVYIYEWDGNTWNPLGNPIDGDATLGRVFGYSVSLDGDRLAIGDPKHDGYRTDAGRVHIYEWDGAAWNLLGNPIDGENAHDESGHSVALDGNRVAIGAHLNDDNGTNAGQVRVYEWNGTTWNQLGMDLDGKAADYRAGVSVDLKGTTLAVGAPTAGWASAGYVRLYEWDGVAWNQLGTDVTDAFAHGNGFGAAISLSQGRVAVGAPSHNFGRKVRLYEWNGTDWGQIGQTLYGDTPDGHFGIAVSLDQGKVAIGAPYDGPTISYRSAGQVKVYDISTLIAVEQLPYDERLNYTLLNVPIANELKLQKQTAEPVHLYLFDPAGHLLHTQLLQGQLETIDVSHLPAGTYFVSLSDGKAQVTKKVVKQ